MTRLEQAIRAANERKTAAIGGQDDETARVVMGSELADRAVFSGFDIDYAELIATSNAVGEFYASNAHVLGLRALFVSAWCDGLLTGIFLASLPPNHGSGVLEDAGPVEGG